MQIIFYSRSMEGIFREVLPTSIALIIYQFLKPDHQLSLISIRQIGCSCKEVLTEIQIQGCQTEIPTLEAHFSSTVLSAISWKASGDL